MKNEEAFEKWCLDNKVPSEGDYQGLRTKMILSEVWTACEAHYESKLKAIDKEIEKLEKNKATVKKIGFNTSTELLSAGIEGLQRAKEILTGGKD